MKIPSIGNVMKKSKCDVVYVYKQQKNEEELRYSIRSVCKNFPHRNIYIVCDKRPRWANENLKCILVENKKDKYYDVNNKLIKACNIEDISDNFWLFNDDFFILKEMYDNQKNYFEGLLEDKLELLEQRKNVDSNYFERLAFLENYCFTTYNKPPLNFELHRPFRYNKQLLKEVLSTDIKCAGRNSLYGAYTEGNPNTAKVSYGHDYKIYGLNDKIDITKDVVSTSNLAFIGHAGRIIKQMFPERSIYEN